MYEGTNYQAPSQSQPSNQARSPSLAKTVHSLSHESQRFTNDFEEFKAETRGTWQSLMTHLSHLTTVINKFESKKGVLPAQIEMPPKLQVNAVTLDPLEEKVEEPVEEPLEIEDKKHDAEEKAKEPEQENETILPKPVDKEDIENTPPFPKSLAKKRGAKLMRTMLKEFKKVEINIPLVTALKSLPKCAEFFVELCTRKVQYPDDMRFQVGKNVSAILTSDLPKKCEDPGMFYIPCVLGKTKIDQAMLDLGASINVMSISMYQRLKLGPLKPSRAVIQLADKSSIYPEGILENVLVKVQDLIFPADFYVLYMGNTKVKKPSILLGRPFLMTARMVIDCGTGKMSCKFGAETVTFDIYKMEQHHNNTNKVDAADSVKLMVEDSLPQILVKDGYDQAIQGGSMSLEPQDKKVVEAVQALKAVEEETRALQKEYNEDKTSIKESLPDEKLFGVKAFKPWYAALVKYITAGSIPLGMDEYQSNKLKMESEAYIWKDPYLWIKCPDEMNGRCVPDDEQHEVMGYFLEKDCGGYFGHRKMVREILDNGFYWPTIWKDLYDKCNCNKEPEKVLYYGRAPKYKEEDPEQEGSAYV